MSYNPKWPKWTKRLTVNKECPVPYKGRWWGEPGILKIYNKMKKEVGNPRDKW